MKITFLYHSGFIIENEKFALIIDYYKDSAENTANSLIDSFQGKIYVLATHWHPDHFNREILRWKSIRPDLQYILSSDIPKKKLVPKDFSGVSMTKGDKWQDENICIKAFGSTDVGVSFLIEAEGKKIFHAGDLNNWHWDEESTQEEIQEAEQNFLKELKLLHDETQNLDVVMFPVDIRLGKNYMRGAKQFVDMIHVGTFIPMHFGKAYTEANAFSEYAEKAGCRFLKLTKTNETIII
jgi:hypothetical protein